MNMPIRYEQKPQPCEEWAERLVMTRLGKLSAEDQGTFEVHASSCSACCAVLEEYRLMDTYRLRSAAIKPPLDVPSQLQDAWKEACSRRSVVALTRRLTKKRIREHFRYESRLPIDE